MRLLIPLWRWRIARLKGDWYRCPLCGAPVRLESETTYDDWWGGTEYSWWCEGPCVDTDKEHRDAYDCGWAEEAVVDMAAERCARRARLEADVARWEGCR